MWRWRERVNGNGGKGWRGLRRIICGGGVGSYQRQWTVAARHGCGGEIGDGRWSRDEAGNICVFLALAIDRAGPRRFLATLATPLPPVDWVRLWGAERRIRPLWREKQI
jgi:hypothetical protein